jgi:hypothetical protein
MDAVRDVLDLGDRWAIILAHDAAARALVAELMSSDAPSLEPLRDVLDPSDEKQVEFAVQQIHLFFKNFGEQGFIDLPSILGKYADAALPELLRPAIRAEEISYRNPIELILLGSGVAVLAAVQAFRLVRDWNSRKQIGQAAAKTAEAQARIDVARADIVEYFAGEVTAGRVQVKPSEFAKLATPTDLKALSALVGAETTLELPRGLAGMFGSDEKDKDKKG